MKSYSKDQQGFGTVEALLILVIVVIVGFVGWFVYNTNQKASKTIDSANQSNSNSQAVNLTSTNTSSAAGTKAKEVATHLLNYSQTESKLTLHSYVDKHVNDGEFTVAFKTAADNGTTLASGSVNPVYCSSTEPTGFKVSSTKMSGDTAVVTLGLVTSDKSAVSQVPQLTLNYAKGIWSVDQYSCSVSPS